MDYRKSWSPVVENGMKEDLRINHWISIEAKELKWTSTGASGPGGQHVNKVHTKVDLRFNLPENTSLSMGVKSRFRRLPEARFDAKGWLLVVCQSNRSQLRNREEAMEKLRTLILRSLVVPKRRRPTRVSKGAKRRRLEAKRQRSELKKGRKKPE